MNARCGVNAEVYRKTGACLKLIFPDRAVSFAFSRSPRLPPLQTGRNLGRSLHEKPIADGDRGCFAALAKAASAAIG
jgi:hypothetical protein